ERAPGREQLLARARRRLLDPEQRAHPRPNPAALLLVGQELRQTRVQLVRGGSDVVAFRDARAPPDHLAERPERQTLTIGRRAAVMPVHGFDEAVEILLELPSQPALPDSGHARDGNHSRPAVPAGGMEAFLERRELGLAADERRLDQLAASRAAHLADDAL